MNKFPLMLLPLAALAACSDQEPPEKTVWDEQLQTMDKARDVEQQLLDSADKQKQQIEQQSE
jgi:hypothetical protein